jgi:hypothetical protein
VTSPIINPVPQLKVVVNQGNGKSFLATLYQDSAGTVPLDMTNCTAKCYAKKAYGAPTAFQPIVQIQNNPSLSGSPLCNLFIEITAAMTLSAGPSTYLFDVLVTPSTGASFNDPVTVLGGTIEILRTVTTS